MFISIGSRIGGKSYIFKILNHTKKNMLKLSSIFQQSIILLRIVMLSFLYFFDVVDSK